MLRRHLKIGLAGGWVLFGAYMLHVVVMAGIALLVTTDVLRWKGEEAAVVLEIGAVIAWIVGVILSLIGWFALGKLERRARLMGWLVAGLFVVTLGGVALSAELGRRNDVTPVALVVVLYTSCFYALHGVTWLRHRQHRGLAVTAAVGSFIALGSMVVAALVVLGPLARMPEVILVVFFAGPVGAAVAHLAAGLAMGRERVSVDVVTGFD